ncbi:hypothetical protein [Gimesia aquarii]|nr:hypothetical protein [Gimesia aquarii]
MKNHDAKAVLLFVTCINLVSSSISCMWPRRVSTNVGTLSLTNRPSIEDSVGGRIAFVCFFFKGEVMKTFNVLLCRKTDLENEKTFTELEDLKTVEIKAMNYEAAVMIVHQEHSPDGWAILTCEEQHFVEGAQKFVVTE